jgi:1,4-dihydroxy-2-naphthoate octaprenyltransferase
VQTEHIRALAFELAVPVGLLAAAILMVNNIRDIDTDRRAGKRTLAVRLGRLRARRLYALSLLIPYIAIVVIVASGHGTAWLLLALASAPLGPSLVRTIGTRTDGPTLNGALAGTGQLLGVFSLLCSIGLLLSS